MRGMQRGDHVKQGRALLVQRRQQAAVQGIEVQVGVVAVAAARHAENGANVKSARAKFKFSR